MPTLSNHDVLGPMTWASGGNSRQRYFPQDSLARSDARGGINSLLFEDSCAGNGAAVPASEHAYAASDSPCHRNSMVSANGYYGFHQQHGLNGLNGLNGHGAVLGQDCSMDTGENNPPVSAGAGFGGSPSAGALSFDASHGGPTGSFPLGPAPQHVWNANADPFPFRSHGATATRKRSLEARGQGVGGWCDAGAGLADADAEDMAGLCIKRTRPSPSDPAQVMTEAPAQAMAQDAEGCGMHVSASAPSTSEQSHSPAQMYALPIHQLPGSTSQLADAMTPRPRCLMGHFI